jgi:hypothetical protein
LGWLVIVFGSGFGWTEKVKRDKAWVRRYLDGGREESTAFTRLHQIICLPTAKTSTKYPVK